MRSHGSHIPKTTTGSATLVNRSCSENFEVKVIGDTVDFETSKSQCFGCLTI